MIGHGHAERWQRNRPHDGEPPRELGAYAVAYPSAISREIIDGLRTEAMAALTESHSWSYF